jgi:CARDB
MKFSSLNDRIRRALHRPWRWPRTLMHWFCIVLFLISHTAVLWLEPTQADAAMPRAAKQMMAALTHQNEVLVKAAPINRKPLKQERSQDSRSKKSFTVAQANGSDLVVTRLSSSDPDASWGQVVELTWTVTNQGNQSTSAGWQDQAYISADAIIDSSDNPLDLSARPNWGKPFAPGDSYTVTKSYTVSSSFINKPYLLLATDTLNQVAETNETNNVQAINLLAPPDLAPIAASAPAYQLGDSIPITWTVTNRSAHRANLIWYDRAYLSVDPVWDSSDYLIDLSSGLQIRPGANVEPIDAGSSYTVTKVYTIPTSLDPDRPYILLRVDDSQQQNETNEENNVIVVNAFRYLGFDPLKPFRDALATLTGAAYDAVASYSNLIVEGEGNISEGIATGNLSLQALGYAQAVLGYAGGLTAGLAVEENLLSTSTVLGGLIVGPGLAGTQLGKAILTNPIIATSLNAVGIASDIAELNTVLNDSNLSLPEKLLRSTNAVLGLGTNALDVVQLASRIRISDVGLELAAVRLPEAPTIDVKGLGTQALSDEFTQLQRQLGLTTQTSDLLQRSDLSSDVISNLDTTAKLAAEDLGYYTYALQNRADVITFTTFAASGMDLRTAENILVSNDRGGGGLSGVMPTINEIETFSVVKQNSKLSCGVSCGATVLRDMGVNVTQDDIATAAGTEFVNGEELSAALNKVDNTSGTWYGEPLENLSSDFMQKKIQERNANGSWIAQLGNVPGVCHLCDE